MRQDSMKAFSTTYVNEAHSRQETQRRQIEKTKGQKASGTKKKAPAEKIQKILSVPRMRAWAMFMHRSDTRVGFRVKFICIKSLWGAHAAYRRATTTSRASCRNTTAVQLFPHDGFEFLLSLYLANTRRGVNQPCSGTCP